VEELGRAEDAGKLARRVACGVEADLDLTGAVEPWTFEAPPPVPEGGLGVWGPAQAGERLPADALQQGTGLGAALAEGLTAPAAPALAVPVQPKCSRGGVCWVAVPRPPLLGGNTQGGPLPSGTWFWTWLQVVRRRVQERRGRGSSTTGEAAPAPAPASAEAPPAQALPPALRLPAPARHGSALSSTPATPASPSKGGRAALVGASGLGWAGAPCEHACAGHRGCFGGIGGGGWRAGGRAGWQWVLCRGIGRAPATD
jgi:hypothetical protein